MDGAPQAQERKHGPRPGKSPGGMFLYVNIFLAPSRSPRNANLRSSVCSMKVCLEFTIFIFWPKIFHDDFRMTSG